MRTITLAALAMLAASALSQDEAHWIWITSSAQTGQTAYFRTGLDIPSPVRAATLTATCDNRFVVYIDGTALARGDAWEVPVVADAAGLLTPGRHVLAVRGENDSGPAGLALRLDIELESGETVRVVSSPRWSASGEAAEGWNNKGYIPRDWRPAVSLGSVTDDSLPWGAVMHVRTATPTSRITIPEGFTLDLVRSAQAGEGSWIAMAIDAEGTIVVAAESGGLLRIETPEHAPVRVERLDADIGTCQGLLFAHGALYATVTEEADRDGGLHRLRDADADGRFETHDVLARFPHKSEHGAHGLALGPDNLLYMIHGNFAPLPERLDTLRSPYAHWEEDLALPRLWDANGHAVDVMAPGCRVLRTDPDATRFEIVSAGMRNAYDLAFSSTGDLFAYDSDMEWDIGAPWYRPPRLAHCVEGAEFGWRSGSGKWPVSYPDSLPPVLETDLASPTGMAFAPPGAFPGAWDQALLMGDWAYGRILGVKLTPRGSSFDGEWEAFATGTPLNVTDMVFDTDGSLWFVTGGRGTQSGLYRVRARADAPGARAGADEMFHVEHFEARARRAELEALRPSEDPGALDRAWEHLGHEDRFVRNAARLVLERRDPSAWRARALAEASPDAAIQALLALARVDSDRNVVIDRACALDIPGGEVERLIGALRVVMVAYARGGDPSDPTRARVIDRFDTMYPSGDAALDRELGIVLTRARAPGIAPRLLARVRSAREQEEALHAAMLLRLVCEDLDEGGRVEYIRWLRGAATLPGGFSLGGFVRNIEAAALERFDGDARARVLAAVGEGEGGEAAPAPGRPFVRSWNVAEVAALGDRAGSAPRGREVFIAARCVSCHRFAGSGGSTGPDLTGVSRRFSAEDLARAVVEPSAVVSDQYRASVVRMRDGRVLTGRVTRPFGSRLTILTDPYSVRGTDVTEGEVESIEPAAASLMPAGLLDTFGEREVADLLAYLRSGGE